MEDALHRWQADRGALASGLLPAALALRRGAGARARGEPKSGKGVAAAAEEGPLPGVRRAKGNLRRWPFQRISLVDSVDRW